MVVVIDLEMASGKTFMFLPKFLYLLLLLQPVLSHSIVEFLPGFDGPLPFALETGYVGVQSEDVQLFYYFFPSESNPKEDPLVLWLTGGPGCSCISGILYEIGPIKFKEVKYNGSLPGLELNPYSWTKVASIIFVDLPVGTGFSYATTPEASHSSTFKASRNTNEFLRKWLIDHPEFQSNPMYLGGDSHVGLTLPIYFDEMSQANEEGVKPFINLKGYLLGNPVTNYQYETNFRIPFAHGMGLISDELYESLEKNCKGDYNKQTQDPSNPDCQRNLLSYDKTIQGIQFAHVLEELCELESPKPPHGSLESLRRSLYQDDSQDILNRHSSLSSLGAFSCRSEAYILSCYWLNDESVREAIHVRKGSIGRWVRCDFGVDFTSDVNDTTMYHNSLTSKGYRALIYSGDHDMLVPFLGTQDWIRNLNYSIVHDWRPWIVEGQVGGYTRTYSNNMTFATVKGGGHTAPEYRPKECHAMFARWISGKPLHF